MAGRPIRAAPLCGFGCLREPVSVANAVSRITLLLTPGAAPGLLLGLLCLHSSLL